MTELEKLILENQAVIIRALRINGNFLYETLNNDLRKQEAKTNEYLAFKKQHKKQE
jgi:hypothetical protein